MIRDEYRIEEYTKPIKIDQMKVGDLIEPVWLWDPKHRVTEITETHVHFDDGQIFKKKDFVHDKFRIVKTRRTKKLPW